MVTRHLECEQCQARGKITLKGEDLRQSDVVYCPVCSADIYEPEELDEEE